MVSNINTTKVGSLKKNELYRKDLELDLLYKYIMENISTDGLSLEEISVLKGYINKEFLNFNFNIQKVIKTDIISHMVIPLVSNCNLNCRYCDAYAPLCKTDTYMNSNSGILSDVKRLKDLGFKIKEISLEGGEPFLYKDILALCRDLRSMLPLEPIIILTNGTLLNTLDKSYWECFSEYKISIIIDNYFQDTDYSDITRICKDLGIHCEVHNSYSKEGFFYKAPIDINSKEDSTEHYLLCEKGHRCITLLKGKLCICGREAYIENFNNFFNTNLPTDSIDIYDNDKQAIINKMASPSRLCKYCCYYEDTKSNWSPSNKDIQEWAK